MSFQNCFTRLKKFAEESGLEGRSIPAARLEFLAKQLHNIAGESMTPAEFAAKAQEFIDSSQMREQAARKAANALSLQTREQLTRNALENIKQWKADIAAGQKGDPLKMATEAVRVAFEGGSLRPGKGSNESPYLMASRVQSQIWTLFKQAIGPELDHVVSVSRALDREGLLALDAIDRKTPLTEFSPEAIAYAKGMKVVRDKVFSMEQARNPFMMKAQDYLWQQMHDRERVTAAGKNTWVAKMMEAAGDKSFPEATVQEKAGIFGDIYDKITSGKWGSTMPEMERRGPGQQILRRQAASRTIQFNDAESFANYNAEFGPKTLYDGLNRIISRSSRDIALLQKFGPDPEYVKEALIARVDSMLSGPEQEQFRADRKKLDATWDVVNGAQNAPARGFRAKFVEGLMTQQWAAKGGLGLFHAIPSDLAMGASLFHQLEGTGMLNNFSKLAGEYISSLNPAHRAEAMENAGYMTKAMQREVMRTFGAPDQSNDWMSKVSNFMSKWSGHDLHADMMASATGGLALRKLGQMAAMDHAALPDSWKQGLARYGIGDKEWNLFKQGAESIGGEMHLTPEGVERLQPEAIEKYLRETGQLSPSKTMTESQRVRISDEFGMKLGTMVNEQVTLSSGRTDLRQRAFMWGATDINSGIGQLRRLMLEFGGPQQVAQDVMRRGYYSGKGGNWEIPIKQMVLTMALMAFAKGLKEVASTGKTPSSPVTPDGAMQLVAESGALGLYGRFLQGMVGQKTAEDRLKGMLKAGAGPGISTIGEGVSLIGTKSKDLGREAAKFGLDNLPLGFNTFVYSKAAFDYYIGNQIKEMAKAGHLAAMERHTAQTPGLFEEKQRYLFAKPTGSSFTEGSQ